MSRDRHLSRWALGLLLAVCVGGCPRSNAPTSPVPDAPSQRAEPAYETELTRKGPSPQPWAPVPHADGVTRENYKSAGRVLKGWLKRPKGGGSSVSPGLLCIHGGFAFALEDLTMCELFVKAGYVVFAPTFRGENGNPGNFELLVGEVDDAIAAARHLASLPFVDAKRVYAFGHSAGGGIAALMTLRPDSPVVHTGGCGGLYTPETFGHWSISPFDTANPKERQLRVLLGRVDSMRVDHFAFMGVEDRYQVLANRAAPEIGGDSRLKLQSLPGDHYGSLPAAAQAYLDILTSTKAR